MSKKFKSLLSIICLLAVIVASLGGCGSDVATGVPTTDAVTTEGQEIVENTQSESDEGWVDLEDEPATSPAGGSSDSVGDDNSKAVLSEIPAYSGTPYAIINNNVPSFNKYELTTKGYETYASLDSLGRCGGAVASCGTEIMPKDGEERGSISAVKPSGWVQAQYDWVSGKYLYNRCHLIGWQLSAENANTRNLITGTRYMNVDGMLPFENMVADYIRETGNHVAYRITPIYAGDDLVATGVQMEAYSIEDDGDGICFNVFCYNVQPGVTIDYSTGRSWAEGSQQTTKRVVAAPVETTRKPVETTKQQNAITGQYVLNTNSKKIHKTHCHHINKMNEANKKSYSGSLDDLYSQGYTTCGTCF